MGSVKVCDICMKVLRKEEDVNTLVLRLGTDNPRNKPRHDLEICRVCFLSCERRIRAIQKNRKNPDMISVLEEYPTLGHKNYNKPKRKKDESSKDSYVATKAVSGNPNVNPDDVTVDDSIKALDDAEPNKYS